MAVIRPNAEPAATTVASGDIFLIDGSTGCRALAATSVALRDANGNVALNNVVEGFASTATAGGTTTLTVGSAANQFFTGTAAQTVVLPGTSTLQLGQGFFFQNSSTGSLTITSSGGNAVKVIGPGAFAIVTCIALTGTTAASWQASYFGDIVVSGRVLTVQNSLTLAGTDGTVVTFPSTSATIARTDAGQTFTGTQVFGALTATALTATSLNGNTLTAGTGTLTLAAGKTLTASNSLTLVGTDGTTQTFPSTSATIARTDAGQTFTGTNVFGVLTATSLNGNTITAGSGTLTLAAGKTLTASNTITLAGTDGTTQTFPSTSGTVVTSVSSNVVTNAIAAQAGAATLKMNATAATANVTDSTIQGLTNLAAPSATLDFIPIFDHASGTIKNVTPGAIASAAVAGVASFKTRTGAVVPVQGDYPTNLIPGTTTNDNATAGNIGEFVSSTVLSGSAVSMTNSTAKDITTISLTAGDWDVWGMVAFLPVAGTTTVSGLLAWIGTTANTVPTPPNGGALNTLQVNFITGAEQRLPTGMIRISIAGTTTVSLGGLASFGVSTLTAYGFIGARRAR